MDAFHAGFASELVSCFPALVKQAAHIPHAPEPASLVSKIPPGIRSGAGRFAGGTLAAALIHKLIDPDVTAGEALTGGGAWTGGRMLGEAAGHKAGLGTLGKGGLGILGALLGVRALHALRNQSHGKMEKEGGFRGMRFGGVRAARRSQHLSEEVQRALRARAARGAGVQDIATKSIARRGNVLAPVAGEFETKFGHGMPKRAGAPPLSFDHPDIDDINVDVTVTYNKQVGGETHTYKDVSPPELLTFLGEGRQDQHGRFKRWPHSQWERPHTQLGAMSKKGAADTGAMAVLSRKLGFGDVTPPQSQPRPVASLRTKRHEKIGWEDKIPGGLADKKTPDEFDQEQLARGTRAEKEHTDDEQLAKEMAMDHLIQDPRYYDKIQKVEESE